MILQLVVLLVMIGIVIVWVGRGFFSGLLHLACVVVAGAVAFAFWEPLALLLLEQTRGTQWITDIAWGVALAVPFAAAAALLSATMNSVVRGNLRVHPTADMIGGGLCGLGIAIIAGGILTISISHTRTKADFGLMGVDYAPSGGSVIATGGPWIPVDQWTAWFYSHVSLGALSTSRPLAIYHPELAAMGHLQRLSPDEEIIYRRLPPDAFQFRARYRIEGGSAADLMRGRDRERSMVFNEGSVSTATLVDLRNQPIASGPVAVEGFVVKPTSSALEERGNNVLTWVGAATLVLRYGETSNIITRQPFAVVSQLTRKADGSAGPYGLNFFNGIKLFFATPPGSDPNPIGFEFLVPNDPMWKPIALYVRGIRFDLEKLAPTPSRVFRAPTERLAALDSLMTQTVGGPPLDMTHVRVLDSSAFASAVGGAGPLAANDGLGMLQLTKNDIDRLVLDGNSIIRGTADLRRDQLATRGGTDRSLIVRDFKITDALGSQQVIVQMDVSMDSPFWLAQPAWEPHRMAGAPVLVDTNGGRHPCIGFISEHENRIRIRFTPSDPIRNMIELEQVNPMRDQTRKLRLIFVVPFNTRIDHVALGNVAVYRLQPPILFNQAQGGRR
jgi:hypothetical protein